MSILIDKSTRVLVQGLGKAALFHAQQCKVPTTGIAAVTGGYTVTLPPQVAYAVPTNEPLRLSIRDATIRRVFAAWLRYPALTPDDPSAPQPGSHPSPPPSGGITPGGAIAAR